MNLQLLPKLSDSITFIYFEKGRLERDNGSLVFLDSGGGTTIIPVATLCTIMLGPGTSATQAAIALAIKYGCTISWTGEECVRFYAAGIGETHKSLNLIKQASYVSYPDKHINVVRKMFEIRFGEKVDATLTLQQLRGMEGRRMRDIYNKFSESTNIPWNGRMYKTKWEDLDTINKALSTANSCLYSVCHSAVVSLGYSPGLGFIHRGQQLSFVYDIADLYKHIITIPIAFNLVKEDCKNISKRVRYSCRDYFKENNLLEQIVYDINYLFGD